MQTLSPVTRASGEPSSVNETASLFPVKMITRKIQLLRMVARTWRIQSETNTPKKGRATHAGLSTQRARHRQRRLLALLRPKPPAVRGQALAGVACRRRQNQ